MFQSHTKAKLDDKWVLFEVQMWSIYSQLGSYFKAIDFHTNFDCQSNVFLSYWDLTSVSTTFSVVALACWSVLIFSSRSLTTSLIASRWRWTFSNSSSCSLFSCSSIHVSSSWRIWWRALNSPLTRACSSALTLWSTEDWSYIKKKHRWNQMDTLS